MEHLYAFAAQNDLTTLGGYAQTIRTGWFVVGDSPIIGLSIDLSFSGRRTQHPLAYIWPWVNRVVRFLLDTCITNGRLMLAQQVQSKVVMPDGQFQTTNDCENSDLFRALRGGSGSAFGIVTEVTMSVEP